MIRGWIRLLSEYTAAQAVIQLLGIASGLLIVNFFPVREYALYTFALSVFTFLALFSDLGVSSALLYFRRETRIAQTAFAPYVSAALRLRLALLAIGAAGGLAFMVALGRERGFMPAELALVALVVLAAAWLQVGASISLLRLRLEGVYRDSYLAEAAGNLLRLLGVAALWLAALPLAWLAMLAGALGSLVTAAMAAGKIPREQTTAVNDQPTGVGRQMKGIQRYVLPTLLAAAYFSIQGPLTVWLSAYFAGTESVAEVGALGRLGMIFAFASGFIGTVLIPRLSAVTDDALYLTRYLQYWLVLAAAGALVVLIAWLLPHWLLLLLGDAYRDLSEGVLLVAISSVLTSWAGYTVGINSARGWVRRMPAVAVIFAGIQVALIACLDLTTTMGVLYYGVWSSLAGLLLQVAINAAGFAKLDWVRVRDGSLPVVK